MTKVMLIGLGRWGSNHLRVLRSLPVELFVAEMQPAQLETARKLGVDEAHCTTNFRDFLNNVDAAVVVTPATSHFSICREFLLAGKEVFVEKPITLKSSEARDLAELADRTNRILQVGHIFRYDTASRWLREAIQNARFGRLQILRSNFSGFKRPRNDSGVMFADAIHFIDLFNYFLSSTPNRVHAITKDFLGRGMEDASLISLEYDTEHGPIWGLVETNYFLPGKVRDLTVIGNELSAVCDFNVAQYKIKTFQNKHVKAGHDFKAQEGTLNQVECPPEEPLMSELRAFLDSVQTRQAPLAGAWDGYHSVRILEAAMESASTGRTIALES